MIFEFLVIGLAIFLLIFSIYALKTLFCYVLSLKKISRKINIVTEKPNSSEIAQIWSNDYHKLIVLAQAKSIDNQPYIKYLELNNTSKMLLSLYEIEFDDEQLLSFERTIDQLKSITRPNSASESESYKFMLDQIPPQITQPESLRYC